MKAVQVRRVAAVLNGGTPTADEANWAGDVPWATPVDLASVNGGTVVATDRTLTNQGLISGSTLAPETAVLLSTRAPIGYTALLTAPTAFNQGCKALVPRAGMVDPRYLQYSLISRADDLKAAGSGSTFLELSSDALARQPIQLAALEEQRRIADFLDDRVSRIDRIIADRREQHHHAGVAQKAVVGEGLATPEQGTRLRYLCDPIDQRLGDATLPLLSVSIHHGVQRRDAVADGPSRAEDLSHYKVVAAGDIVLNRMRAFQGAVGIAREPGCVSPDYLVLRAHDGLNPAWLDVLFRSAWFVGEMTSRIKGIGSVDLGTVRTPRINWSELADIAVEVPSAAQQAGIVSSVHVREDELRAVRSMLEQSIDLLTEYKSSLITAAVTGELDVSTAGSSIPG